MRKRYREPKIYRKDGLYWFRITDSFGKRQEVRAFTDREAKLKRADMIKQLFSDLSGSPTYRSTFEQGIEFWKKSKENTIEASTLDRYGIYLNNFLDFLKEKYPKLNYFDETQKDDSFALNFRNYRLGLHIATKTIKEEEDRIAAVYRLLIRKKKIPNINPFDELDPLSVEPVQKRRALSNDELCKFFGEAKELSVGVFWYGYFMVEYFTGLRRDNIRLMEKGWVNFETGHFELPKTKTRRGKVISKTVPIHPKLTPILEEAISRSQSKYVFPDENGEAMNKNKARYFMHKICKLAGITKATPHDFRHTWATKSRLAGMSNEARREVGGWSSDKVMEKTYTHYPKETIKNEYFAVDFMDFMDKPKP